MIDSEPIVVTGASGHVGRALARRVELRPVGRGDDLAAALAGARVVVHLAGTLAPRRPDTYESANAGTAQRLADAVRGTGVQRIVLLSYAEAGRDPGNAYLASKARAEAVLRATGLEVVILRATYVYGPPGDVGRSFAPYVAKHRLPVVVVGPGTQRMSPVHVDAVAAAIERACTEDRTGTFSLAGLDTLTLDEMIDRVNGRPVRKLHLPPALARRVLNSTLVDVLLRDCLPHDTQF